MKEQANHPTAAPPVLVLNAGSSSLKFAIYENRPSLTRIHSGSIDGIGAPEASFVLKEDAGGRTEKASLSAPDHVTGLDYLLRQLDKTAGGKARFGAVGHRVVHGGPRYREPHIIDRGMLAELRRIRSFDPEHLPGEIALMEACAAKFPDTLQIACFDTAFHSDMPRVAKLLPIPRRYEGQGLRRYGFHGLSYTYLMQELERLAGAEAAGGRVILAHLGNGASMAAVRDGHSLDTTMAFTPAAGLVMGTRSGDVDPGLVSFLAQSEKMSAPDFDHMVNHESGLLGISETSSDMRDLLARETDDVRAAEAVALFCYEAKKRIGAYAAALGGLDTLVFAGGIGENAPVVRARICEGLGFLGIGLSERANATGADVISTDSGAVTVRVIRTDEEQVIARSVLRLLETSGPSQT